MGAFTRRRPLTARLQRAPPPPACRDRDRISRARPRLLRRARDHVQTTALRQCVRLPPQPLAPRVARPPNDPPPADPDPPPTGQRQGRAIPADPETRVGAGPELPHQRPPR